ncbi:MAG: hypothetical protein N2689_02630 [Verrucomicrobiae bacterium]|nr:hypothetical protein [Verrucomicrobiae bacterium]
MTAKRLRPLTLAVLLPALLATLRADEAPKAAAKRTVLEEKFDGELSKDWFWGLGTWIAKGGVLRGFESGPRRHGPVKMRRFPLRDGSVECEFRLDGKATFAGVIFNGSQERGHIVHIVMGGVSSVSSRIRRKARPSSCSSNPPRSLPANGIR